MPQLRLEFSSNIHEKNNMNNLFRQCHSILEKNLPTALNTCKSRAIECTDFYIGDGNSRHAFVHVSLKVMPGRSGEILENVAGKIMALLKEHFAKSLETLNLQITLELMELEKTYYKYASNT